MAKFVPQKDYYLQVRLAVTPECREAVSYLVFANGALGCEDGESDVTAYFEDQDPETLLNKLKSGLRRIASSGLPVPRRRIKLQRLPQQNWQENWKKYFQPVWIERTLVIRPPWEKPIPEAPFEILIEPGLAFGTGTHASTQLVLQAMVERQSHLPDLALDVGTGSGILAIAHAILRPNSRVIAVDNDPVALDNAKENARLNRVHRRCRFRLEDLQTLEIQDMPMVYANLDRQLILKFLPKLANFLQPNGLVLLSGILVSERDQILKALSQYCLSPVEQKKMKEWCLVVARKVKAD